MELLPILLAVAAVDLAGAASPGPGFLAIVRAAAARGRGEGIWSGLGLAAGSAVWASAALFGLSALFAAAPWMQTALRVAGGVYLIWLAIQLWRHAGADRSADSGAGPAGAWPALRRGFLVQIANPKGAAFFGSVFVTVLPAEVSSGAAAAILGAVFVVEALWFAALACAFSAGRVRRAYARLQRGVDRLLGGLMGLIGARLAFG